MASDPTDDVPATDMPATDMPATDVPATDGNGEAAAERTPRLTAVPILAALAVVVAVIVLIVTLGNGNDSGSPTGSEGTSVASDNALACPRDYSQNRNDSNGWVPHPPSGIDAANRLVPAATPTHAVVCRYARLSSPDVTKSVALADRHRLGGDLAGLARDLGAAPRLDAARNVACAAYVARTDGDNYLFGLSYGKDTVWVSAPGNHCDGATNGDFSTSRNLRASADASFSAKKWVNRP